MCRLAPTGGTRLPGTEGAQAQARAGLGLMGRLGLKLFFSIFQGISNCFSIYFL